MPEVSAARRLPAGHNVPFVAHGDVDPCTDGRAAVRRTRGAVAVEAADLMVRLHLDQRRSSAVARGAGRLGCRREGVVVQAATGRIGELDVDARRGVEHADHLLADASRGGALKMQTLDVRPMPPRVRHETIIDRLDQLVAGETLRLVNDHDPAPLRYQLDATRPDQFGWEYVEQGPEEWAIDITSRARVVDARPTLAVGGQPFAEIMEAASTVAAGEILVVYAPFEPVPLEGVLGQHGFTHAAEQLEGGDWRVTFTRQ
jgi:uncharacterized protein (DUF2249 family)